jgi:hypothetical protein
MYPDKELQIEANGKLERKGAKNPEMGFERGVETVETVEVRWWRGRPASLKRGVNEN